MFGSGVVAQDVSEPLPCLYTNNASEVMSAASAANGHVIWVHRQGKDFPPCATDWPLSPPYWIVNREDKNRRFYAFTHDAISSVYSTATRRSNFVTLDELSRGVENISADGQSLSHQTSAVTFASNVYAAEENLVLKLTCSGTLAGLLLALGLWQRGNKWGLLAARAAAGCPLALYAGGMPGLVIPMLVIPWILAAFVPVRLTLAFTTLFVFLDQLSGLRIGDFSPLQGYFSSGIRFYGVGNELLGIITGTLAVCVPKRYRVYTCIGCVLFFGNASLGADFGAVVTFAALIAADSLPRLPWFAKLPKPTVLLASIIIGIITAFAAAVLDMVFSPHMSHGGAALASASSKQSGIVQLFDIIVRKLLMNVEIAVRPATLIAAAAVIGLVWVGRRMFIARQPSQSGVRYLILAVMLSLVFNDSGVVTALMALLPALAMIPEVHQANG